MIVIYYIMQNSFEWQNWMIVNLLVGTVHIRSHVCGVFVLCFEDLYGMKERNREWNIVLLRRGFVASFSIIRWGYFLLFPKKKKKQGMGYLIITNA